MKRLIVLTGAGISAPSGIKTFRDSNGLWENHRIEDVATPEAWRKNPELVLEFYNQRRLNVIHSQPNDAHLFIKELEANFDVQIITQNVDDLHERAGSKNILHLHGEIRKARSSRNEDYIINVNESGLLNKGDLCPQGHQLRPYIVWFGEDVPMYPKALDLVRDCDILLIIGTSLQVYPAANLAYQTKADCLKIVVDPNASGLPMPDNSVVISSSAELAVAEIKKVLSLC